jgi:hypothetical protein
MDKLKHWLLVHPGTVWLILTIGAPSIGFMPWLFCNKKTETPQPKVQKVESWASDRYHFVRMRSMTDEVYTMICDRHTGIESLLAKAYRYPSQDSRDGGNITSMTSVYMGFNPDCLGRDIQAYDRRGRLH